MEKMHFDANGKWLGWTQGNNSSIVEAVHSVKFVGKFDPDAVYSFVNGEIVKRSKTEDEIAAQKIEGEKILAEGDLASLRVERNKRLIETDFWAYPDRPPMTDAQKAYRQALRDITNSYTSLKDVVWPVKP